MRGPAAPDLQRCLLQPDDLPHAAGASVPGGGGVQLRVYILLSVLHHLLEGQCNPDLRLLGCAVLVPRCEGGRARRPCRHVCEALRDACQPAFDAIDMAWPYFLDCSRYFAGQEEGCYNPLEKLRGGPWSPVVVSSWGAGGWIGRTSGGKCLGQGADKEALDAGARLGGWRCVSPRRHPSPAVREQRALF